MMTQTALTVALSLGAAFAGGGVWTLASTWLAQIFRKEEKEVDRLRDAHRRCEESLAALEQRMEAVEHHHASLVPRWITGAGKRIRWINGAAMVTIFGQLGLVREEVEGRRFADLFEPAVAREMDLLDSSALAHPGRAVSTFLQFHPQLPPMHIVKVAGVGRDNELIYEGYGYCANDPEDALDRGLRREEAQLGLSFLRTTRDDAEKS